MGTFQREQGSLGWYEQTCIPCRVCPPCARKWDSIFLRPWRSGLVRNLHDLGHVQDGALGVERHSRAPHNSQPSEKFCQYFVRMYCTPRFPSHRRRTVPNWRRPSATDYPASLCSDLLPSILPYRKSQSQNHYHHETSNNPSLTPPGNSIAHSTSCLHSAARENHTSQLDHFSFVGIVRVPRFETVRTMEECAHFADGLGGKSRRLRQAVVFHRFRGPGKHCGEGESVDVEWKNLEKERENLRVTAPFDRSRESHWPNNTKVQCSTWIFRAIWVPSGLPDCSM
ncbi:hypothetical protein C8R43DRAFT_1031739, partial [Mycena crocata]